MWSDTLCPGLGQKPVSPVQAEPSREGTAPVLSAVHSLSCWNQQNPDQGSLLGLQLVLCALPCPGAAPLPQLLIFCRALLILHSLWPGLLPVNMDTFKRSHLTCFPLTWCSCSGFLNWFPLHLPFLRSLINISFPFMVPSSSGTSSSLLYLSLLPTHLFLALFSHHCIDFSPPQQFLKDVLSPAYLCM